METLIEIGVSAGLGALYSLLFYVTKKQKGEAFQPYKFIRAIVIGLALGGLAQWRTEALTFDNWDVYVGANASAILVVDKVLTAAYRLLVPSSTDG